MIFFLLLLQKFCSTNLLSWWNCSTDLILKVTLRILSRWNNSKMIKKEDNCGLCGYVKVRHHEINYFHPPLYVIFRYKLCVLVWLLSERKIGVTHNYQSMQFVPGYPKHALLKIFFNEKVLDLDVSNCPWNCQSLCW